MYGTEAPHSSHISFWNWIIRSSLFAVVVAQTLAQCMFGRVQWTFECKMSNAQLHPRTTEEHSNARVKTHWKYSNRFQLPAKQWLMKKCHKDDKRKIDKNAFQNFEYDSKLPSVYSFGRCVIFFGTCQNATLRLMARKCVDISSPFATTPLQVPASCVHSSFKFVDFRFWVCED